ncbi:hypothetical protein M408DRAFT_63385 [Serendipita vermifera MAFF 305830]|uniref:Uncharacterized protein n=1 Tax=Serendipita vermifera MAFF 305830 TaxID=933852 RepID=A0A0C2X1W4_SERVB|nr:hypothetical protein M408DRAFT_63385 [Serendipita vermifera MAFF 305830]
MQANNAPSASPVNLSAVFAQFTRLAPVSNGRNLHKLALEDTETPIPGDDDPSVAANKLLDVLRGINLSLTTAMAQPVLDQRIITLYKENSEHEHAIQKAALTAQLTLQALSTAHQSANLTNYYRPSAFGLDLPLSRSRISSFILSSVEKWATDAGLEFFLEDQQASTIDPSVPGSANEASGAVKTKKTTVSLAKEQLLVDIEFEIHPLAEDKRVDLVQNDAVVPISLQHVSIHNGEKDSSNTPGDGNLGGTLQLLLEETIQAFLTELGCHSGPAWRSVDVLKAERAAAKLKTLLGELNWIADKVKQETEKSADSGAEWNDCVSVMAEKAMGLLRKEAEPIQAQREVAVNSRIPIDLLALRTSGIPIPYLFSFSLSFLLYLSPLAYLSLLRKVDAPVQSSPDKEIMDISFTSIRQTLSHIEARERLDILLASISYAPNPASSKLLPIANQAPVVPESSTLDSSGDLMEYRFLTGSGSDTINGQWFLSFSSREMGRPIIVSQSRMKRIASTLNIEATSKDDGFVLMGLTGGSMIQGPSWLDLVMDPHCTQPSRVYTSRYQSTSGANTDVPDLVNTLAAITEPGFALGKLPVRTFREVYAVMVIVKEQIWLQSLLQGAGFQPGYSATDLSGVDGAGQMMGNMNLGGNPVMSAEEAKAMYDALTSGTYVTKRLRVTYEVLSDGQTGMRIAFPHGGAPMITDVTLDTALPKGVKVTVNGQRVEQLEEVVRRGGLLGLVISVRNFVSNRV